MTDVLKGNFKPQQPVPAPEPAPDDLTAQFEHEALKRVGGSIAFVNKAKFTLGMDEPEPAEEQSNEPR